ncbi:hypothetical protein CHO01_01780 [Cellulomonas hominis]|uniref:Lipoprotein n=1 Tax=Cellulomonas hominis TaxID=156981 RepID=A0A511F6Y9_9CELL|nr:hypothetical protein CHO01_01780 [Cellulomonas hominis]
MAGRGLALVPVLAAVTLGGCGGPAGPAPAGAPASAPEGTDAEATPSWRLDGTPQTTVSFADGPALAAATDVTFSNGLGEIWDWEVVAGPDATTTAAEPPVTLELHNTGNDCRVLDERSPSAGTGADDAAASTALVEDRLAGAEVVAGPVPDAVGLGEGLGEGGPTYEVARALGRTTDGGWLLVTARAFTALGVQQVVTVTCPTGDGIDLARGQLAQIAYADVHGLQPLP